jgi:hypothetical protein
MDVFDISMRIRAAYDDHVECWGPSFGWPEVVYIVCKAGDGAVIFSAMFEAG